MLRRNTELDPRCSGGINDHSSMFQRAAGTGRGSTPLTIIHLIKLSVCLFPVSPWKRLRVTSDLLSIHSNQTSFSGGKSIGQSSEMHADKADSKGQRPPPPPWLRILAESKQVFSLLLCSSFWALPDSSPFPVNLGALKDAQGKLFFPHLAHTSEQPLHH